MAVVLASALEGLEAEAADTTASAYHLVLVVMVAVDSPEEVLTAVVGILMAEHLNRLMEAVETIAAGREEDLA